MTGEPAESDIFQRRVVFHGRVQGVGFRYSTQSLARSFEVGGSVKNLADGTVELVVCGSQSEIDGLLEAIAARFDGNIKQTDSHPLDSCDFQPADGVVIQR